MALYDSSNNLTTTGYTIYILILIATYVYCIVLSAGYLPDWLDNVQKSCIVSCKDEICCNKSTNGRGKALFLDDPKKSKEMNSCRYTYWNLAHFLYFLVLTYIFPSLWIYNLGISLLFEYYEYAYLDCHDINDLPANTLGIMLGYVFSKL